MKILAVGGGSGGHVTPIAAVIRSLKSADPQIEFRVWCDKKFARQAKETIHQVDPGILVDTIPSGKFRRYESIPMWQQLLRLRTIVLPNIRDSFFLTAGFFQSYFKLKRWRPDIIFCKGGFVCLPVGLAAKLLKIPFVIHDSDAYPGLTNRILARWAKKIGTGAPPEYYPYEADKISYVGVPIDSRCRIYNTDEQALFKETHGFSARRPLVVVTGGGLGADAINKATIAILGDLTEATNVLLVSGATHYQKLAEETAQYPRDTFLLRGYVSDGMIELLAAADLVVARAGATTLLELAGLAKPTIIVPSPYLSGDHQTKNAEMYETKGAAMVVDEKHLHDRPDTLLELIEELLNDPNKMAEMGQRMHEFARPNAANDVAKLILDAAKEAL